MHPLLEEAASKVGLADGLPALRDCAEFSENVIQESRSFLPSEVPTEKVPLDVLALGSVARHEATRSSDFDYLIVAHALPQEITKTRDLMAAADRLRESLQLGQPGRTGIFGRVVSAPELTERIGLEEDTNVSHTRRILILEESVSIYQPALHGKLMRALLARYLADYPVPKKGVPRFLLNDVLRYWRTLTVDYQAKRWEEVEPEWGLRYLKLILSRKLAFAGTVASLFLCKEATVDYFEEQFSIPPLARFAQVSKSLEGDLLDSFRKCLEVAEEFSSALADESFREEAKAIKSRSEVQEGSRFEHIQRLDKPLQDSLEAIFFESDELRSISRTYLSF